MEMSHRGKDFMKIAEEAGPPRARRHPRQLQGARPRRGFPFPDRARVRKTRRPPPRRCDIYPDDPSPPPRTPRRPRHDRPPSSRPPQVLFLQGGASSQFAAIPMNLAPEGGVADFVLTGAWGKKAFAEAKKYMDVNVAATSAESNFDTIPDVSEWKLTPGAKFVHICSNETIGGVEFKDVPDTGGALVADMSSNYLSKPIEWRSTAPSTAACRRTSAPRDGDRHRPRRPHRGDEPELPDDVRLQAHGRQRLHVQHAPAGRCTPPACVFKKLLKMGGLEAVEKMNIEKAKLLYDAIEGSDGYYVSPVDPKYRSLMNVPFTLGGGADLEKKFLAEAAAAGLESLKGHRSVGGARASIYNAMPMEGVQALVDFMAEFKKNN